MLISLPAEKFHRDAKDFAAQLRKHYDWTKKQPVAEAGPNAFEGYLTNRILNGRGTRWIDRLELNVASRACEVLGLRVAKGSSSPLTGHSDADWMAFGVMGYDVLKDGPVALSECLAAMALEDGVDGRFFGRVFGSWAMWLKSRGLGEEFEPLRNIVRRHVFDSYSVRKGVLVFGVASEGMAAANAPKPCSLKGFSRRNAEDLIRRGLAERRADGEIIPMSFVTQHMLNAYEREKRAFRTEGRRRADAKTGDHGAVANTTMSDAHVSIGGVARQLRVTAKTVSYLLEHGLLRGVDASELHRRGANLVASESLAAFQKEFISLGEAAEVIRRPMGALSMRLRNANMALLAMPHDLSRIYWREDWCVYLGATLNAAKGGAAC